MNANPTVFSWRSGDWSDLKSLEVALEAIRGHKYACTYHDAVADRMRSLGWQVAREWAVTMDGIGGAVDIVAVRPTGRMVALELDNRTPRGKSILKLQTFDASVACAVLVRNPRTPFNR